MSRRRRVLCDQFSPRERGKWARRKKAAAREMSRGKRRKNPKEGRDRVFSQTNYYQSLSVPTERVPIIFKF